VRRSKKNIFEDVDLILLGLFLFLSLLGWFNIYAASYNENAPSIFDFSQNYGKQLVWILSSLILGFIVMLADERIFEQFSYFIYGLFIFLLVLVLVAGSEIKGSKSWFVIGPISLQPAEFAKYGTALALSRYLSNANVAFKELKTRFVTFALLLLPCVFIVLQPDPGSTLVYVSFVFVLYREGLSGNVLLILFFAAILFILTLFLKQSFIQLPIIDFQLNGKYILILSLVVIGSIVWLLLKNFNKKIWRPIVLGLIICLGLILSVDYIFDNVFADRHRNRINELLGIISDPQGTGYNQHQSKIAIGSGGFWGKGYMQGTQTKFNFVPEQSTDFIFCTVGEEWGFVGSLLIIILFLVLIIRIIMIAERQRSRMSRIYGYSVASIFFFHFAINIAMTIGLAPVIGIPLPFFSYGGSSLWAFAILLFTLLKLDSQRKYVLQ
jgi:rod shape determining protein RodA